MPYAQEIFFARSRVAPKGWSYDHVGFITQDGKQIQMSGHKGNDVYVTNDVTDDPEFPQQQIKIVSLPKLVSVPTANSVGAENCGMFVANVLQANGIEGFNTEQLYRVFKQPQRQSVVESLELYKPENPRFIGVNFFSQVIESFCKDYLIESAVAQGKAQIANTLNQNAAKLTTQAKDAGFKVEADYVSDVDEAIEPAIINVQLGYNSKTAESSQWITITVYDDTDIKVRLTNKIKQIIGENDSYLAFESLDEAMNYLARVYDFCK